MKTINKIRSKDPDIYDAKKEWFKPGDKAGGGRSSGECASRSKNISTLRAPERCIILEERSLHSNVWRRLPTSS